MNHKRGRPKNRRSGCLLCKPWKANGADRRTMGEIRRDASDRVDALQASVRAEAS